MRSFFCLLLLFFSEALQSQQLQYESKYKDVDSLLNIDNPLTQMEGRKLLETKYIKDTSSSSYWLMVARANNVNMKLSKVLDNINKSIQVDPKNDEAYFEKARYFYDREGDIMTAYNLMNECLSLDKKAVYYFYRGIYAQLLGRYDEAIDNYDKTISLNYYDEGLFRNYSILLLQKNNPQKALTIIQKAISLEPNASNYHTLGQVYAALLDLENMCKSFTMAYNKGYSKKNDFDNLICKNKTEKNKYMLLGDAFYLVKSYHYAVQAYTKAMTLAPDSSKLIMNRGVCYYELKDYGNAEKDLLKSLTLKNPFYDLIYHNLSLVSFDQKKLQESINYTNERIKLDSNNYTAYLDRGLCYRQLKKYDLATSDFDKSLKINPTFFRAYGYKAYMYLELDDYQKALELSNKAIDLNPEYGYAYMVRGQVKFAMNKKDYCSDFEMAKQYGENEEAEKALTKFCKQ